MTAERGGKAVPARECGMQVSAFHPELTDGERMRRYFQKREDGFSAGRNGPGTGG